MSPDRRPVVVRNTRPEDIPALTGLCSETYPGSPPWSAVQLESHLRVFPEGQFVAVDPADATILGMSASLIVFWDDYDINTTWRDFTSTGMFTNHNPDRGRTLYGAEVMVRPSVQGRGVGSALYAEREKLVRRLGLLRIRAGARLRGYHRYADTMSSEAYTDAVARGEIFDPTLSFQLRRGFQILTVISNYLRNDPESLGHAAVIEWLNPTFK